MDEIFFISLLPMLYMLLLWIICISFLVNELFSTFLHFYIRFLFIDCKSSLYILVTKLLSAKYAVILSISHVLWYLFFSSL